MDLNVVVGGGTSDLLLTDLSLTRLYVNLGAGITTIDLRGNRTRDLDATIDAGAANLIVRLPKDIGVRVEVDSGPHTVDAPGLTWDGNAYTNAAYGVSGVMLHVNIEAGIGSITLETEEAAAANG